MIREKIDSTFMYFFDQGKSLDAYNVFGAHLNKDENGNILGCEFCLYAPNANYVAVVGDWNGFNTGSNPMENIDNSGIWYAYIEGNYEWNNYKYYFSTKQGETKYKQDPFGYYSGLRPSTNSRVYDIEGYYWNDADWMMNHKKTYDQPVLIYELHMGSWKKKEDGTFYSAAEMAPMLIDYLKEFGYTHVEVMPIYEHPLDASWGYQGTGYYSVSARYGVPKDFMYFVDMLHQNGYGVIMDWVPGHICKDAQGLYLFDGTPLYDYPDPTIRENIEWGTANLDLGKGVTRSFLFSNALFYMKYFHVDGFRVDAVSNILYHLGNTERGVNEGACSFLRELSNIIFGVDDRVLFMAEDSSSFPNVTKPTDIGGIGFNYKWDMGWMNDTLKYFKYDPIFRKYHHHQLTFSMMYYYNEQFVLPFSHDEVVHMKGSLLNKMPGDYWKQFANYRLLMGYMMTHPGKKLLFMGTEYGQFREWDYANSLEWFMLDYPNHTYFRDYTAALNHFYLANRELWELDFDPSGFEWILADEADKNSVVFKRLDKKGRALYVALNFSGGTQYMTIPVIRGVKLESAFDTGNFSPEEKSIKIEKTENGYFANLVLPPYSGIIYKKINANKKIKI